MRFWPFGRRKPEPPPIREDLRATEDWKVGDLAVCIAANWDVDWPDNPKIDDVLRVSHVNITFNHDGAFRFIGLGFVGKHAAKRWANTAFRKANINHEPATMQIDEMIRDAQRMPVPVGSDQSGISQPEEYR